MALVVRQQEQAAAARSSGGSALLAVDVTLTGAPELQRALKQLSDITRGDVIKKAVSAALTPIRAEAKRLAPVRTGALRKDIGKKTKKFRGGNVWGAVGVKKHYARVGGRRTYLRDNPSNYAHLPEFGTVHSAATPYLRPALERKRAEALAILRAKILPSIEAARRKGLR